ncbi:hypothetical protein JHK87_024720 [Glycine soja]|nr:hypothetical protein JHK87_024720 [Glycine soja]
MSSQSFACWADACVSCRDLITLEARVWLPQWTMRNIDDRNRLLLCFLNICKDVLGCLPKVVGIDVVEMALWAKIETRNNNMEMQSVNYKSLIEEFDKLLERSRVPSEYATNLTGGSFDEARMLQNVEACEWLTSALHGLGFA